MSWRDERGSASVEQAGLAALVALLLIAAILLVFRTTDWRGLIREAQEEADNEKAAQAASPP